jgi:hypothetical protein
VKILLTSSILKRATTSQKAKEEPLILTTYAPSAQSATGLWEIIILLMNFLQFPKGHPSCGSVSSTKILKISFQKNHETFGVSRTFGVSGAVDITLNEETLSFHV